MILYGPPGTGKTTLARMLAEYADAAFEELSAVEVGRAEVREVIARATRAPARRPPHDLLPRRDPPLQQGPAGRAAARGRGGARRARRRDDREPVLRGQLRADLARPDLRAAGADRRGHRRAAAARAGRGRRDRHRRGDRVPGHALGRRRARVAERARAGAGHRRAHGRAGDAGRRRGRDAAQGGALRQGRRPALRLHLGLDQVHARVGPRRVAVLPGGDARGRRGPALHRPPDGHPRLRGRRQRRSAGAGGGDRGRARRRPRRAAGVHVRARPGGDLPLAGAEVQRRRASALGAARAHIREHGAQHRRPPRCARPPTRGAQRSAAAAATTTRTTTPATSTTRSTCPRGREDARFYDAGRRRAGVRDRRLAEIRRARGRGPT